MVIQNNSFQSQAADFYRSDPGTHTFITEWDPPGYRVTNNTNKSFLIPTKTRPEFDSFRNRVPLWPNVEICKIVNGGWSSFGGWSACSEQCGGGVRTKQRSCNNPAPSCGGAPCSGSPTITESCNTHPCEFFLYGNIHKNTDCNNIGGYVVTVEGSVKLCKKYLGVTWSSYIYPAGPNIEGNPPPPGWTKYKNWSTTASATWWLWMLDPCASEPYYVLNVWGHSWSDRAVETGTGPGMYFWSPCRWGDISTYPWNLPSKLTYRGIY